jgi:hypothetical protein
MPTWAGAKETTLRDDGRLGPTSDQHSFALCARHIVSGVVLSGTSGTALDKYFDVKIALVAVVYFQIEWVYGRGPAPLRQTSNSPEPGLLDVVMDSTISLRPNSDLTIPR